MTYINTIDIPGEEDAHRQLQRITPLWTGHFAENYPLETESATVQSRFVLRDAGKPFGRAYVTFGPAILVAQNRPVIRLEITVRGKPRNESIPEALRLLDEERSIWFARFQQSLHLRCGRSGEEPMPANNALRQIANEDFVIDGGVRTVSKRQGGAQELRFRQNVGTLQRWSGPEMADRGA